MQKLAEICIRASGLRLDARPGPGGGRRDRLLRPRRRPLSRRWTCRRVNVRTMLPGAVARGGGVARSPSRSRRSSTPSTASTSCARSRGRACSIVIATFRPRPQPRDARPRTCATASARCVNRLPEDAHAAGGPEVRQRQLARPHHRPLRRALAARADRARRQDGARPARAHERRGRGARGGRPRARDQRLDRRRPPGRRTSSPSPTVRQALAAAERRRPRRQRATPAARSWSLRTMGRYTDPARARGPRGREHRDPGQRSAAASGARSGTPIRIRDIGRVEDGTKEQRSFARLNGVPTVTWRSAGSRARTRSRSSTASRPRCRGWRAQLPADVRWR